jgi:hypothetical protein
VANADSDGYPHTVVNTAHEARRPNENDQGNDMKKILGFLLLLLSHVGRGDGPRGGVVTG